MKKIAVGDLGEFWYADYKEPFVQLEGAVEGQPRGVLLKAVADDRLLCAYCGKTFDNLGRHANATHGLPAREYKREVGLLQKSALVSERGRTDLIRRGGLRSTHVLTLDDHSKALAVRRERGLRGNRTPEWANKNGTCYAQALAVARSIATRYGRVTQKRLRQHGIFDNRIREYFGTFDALNALVSASAPRRYGKTYTDQQMLVALRGVSETLGRTPAVSDLRRYGLPSQQAWEGHFGSFSEACRRAGLAPNLPIPMDDDLHGQVLTAYAALGDTNRVARHLHIDPKRVLAVLHRFGFPFPHGSRHNMQQRRDWAAEMARRLASTAAA